MTTKNSDALDGILTQIVKKHLRIDSLEPQNRDALDFHDCHITQIKKALVDAFNAGLEQGKSKK